MKYIFILVLAFSLYAKDINIALSANVGFAIDDLLKQFKKENPNIKVKYTLGGSGKLTAQIKRGAPYDIFMAANMKYPNTLYLDKDAKTKPVIYAKGSLTLFSINKRDFSKGIEILKDKSITKIAMANPKTAPYGVAAKEALENANIYQDVKSKLVYGESISQTVAYSKTAADIGIIAKSALYSDKMKAYKEGENWKEVDQKLYTPISQGMVILKNSQEAKKFYDFILSPKAKSIFRNYGYIVE